MLWRCRRRDITAGNVEILAVTNRDKRMREFRRNNYLIKTEEMREKG